MDVNRFIQLLEIYLQNRAGEDEQNELFLLIASGKYDEEIKRRIDAGFEEDALEMDPVKANEIREYIITKPGVSFGRPQADDGQRGVLPTRQHGVSRTRLRGVSGTGPRVRQMYKYIAAASVIIVASLLVILSLSKNGNGGKPTVAQTHDVPAPSNTRAVITLADGSKVYLDSAGNGVLAKQSDVSVVRNNNGEIIYSPDHQITQSPDHQITYNTLFNPRGSKVISLTLSDGTRVWLNSESSLKYPIAFNDKTREVEITGEAYFEVKHNTKQPFKVHLPNGSVVEDIGTSFNINSYPDEQNIKTTLIEGSIKISSRLSALAVKPTPGEQVIQNTTSPDHYITTSPDIESVLAWKNGFFSFNKTDIGKIMHDLERWYDVEVEYEGTKPNITLSGTINRNINVSKVLQMLELSGVHFQIEGKKIIVSK